MQYKTPSRHDVCVHHEYFILNSSFNEYSSTCSTNSARTDYSSYSREIQTMWSHNHDAGSYETLYGVDSSSGDVLVVIYWTMTGAHVVPDRQQYDEHTHQADMIPGVSLSTPWVFHLKPLFQRVLVDLQHTLCTHWLFILERYKLWPHNHDAGSYETLYKVDSSSVDVVIILDYDKHARCIG